MRRLLTLLKNIKYLSTVLLRERERDLMYQTLLCGRDVIKYNHEDKEICELKVLDYNETIDLLSNNLKSFCRIGDGEIELILGNSISFQKYNKVLAEILLKILRENQENMYVGIDYNLFNPTDNLNEGNEQFCWIQGKKYRDFLLAECNRERTYIGAAFNQLYMILKEYDYKAYYEKIMNLFAGKDIVLFCGKGIWAKTQNNIFQRCRSFILEEGPTRNAFDEYEHLLERAHRYSKDSILCFVLGPTSKALVYNLSQEGYIAWDIGHLVKDYDMYMLGKEKTKENAINFYKPD